MTAPEKPMHKTLLVTFGYDFATEIGYEITPNRNRAYGKDYLCYKVWRRVGPFDRQMVTGREYRTVAAAVARAWRDYQERSDV